MSLELGDVLSLQLPGGACWTQQASVVFINAVCFPPELWSAIEAKLVRDCRKLRFLIIAGPEVGNSIALSGGEAGAGAGAGGGDYDAAAAAAERAETGEAFHRRFSAVRVPAAASWQDDFYLTLYSLTD